MDNTLPRHTGVFKSGQMDSTIPRHIGPLELCTGDTSIVTHMGPFETTPGKVIGIGTVIKRAVSIHDMSEVFCYLVKQ